MGEHLKVRCACGWETSGSEDEIVAATRDHGQRLHNMAATREDVLRMAIPAVTRDAAQGTEASGEALGRPEDLERRTG